MMTTMKPTRFTFNKSYYKANGDEVTITGTADIADPETFKQQMLRREVQTIDPRIRWKREPRSGWTYVDFSFEIVDEKELTDKIMINTDCNAPCCPCEIVDVDSGKTFLVQTDWDYPGVASSFGWNLRSVQKCPHCGEVRTVDDPEMLNQDCPVMLLCHRCDEEEEPVNPSVFRMCEHDGTDGTVRCRECGMEPGAFMAAAYDFLVANDGLQVDDPGYFSDNE